MIAITLKLLSRLACNCPPHEALCPVCRGVGGALPRLNRTAVESAVALAEALSLPALPGFEIGRIPDPAHPRGYRITTTAIAKSGDLSLFLCENPQGMAQVLLITPTDADTADTLRSRLHHLSHLFTDIRPIAPPPPLYSAMDIPPIAL